MSADEVDLIAQQDYQLVSPFGVQVHPQNPRRGDVMAIADSIKANGFYGAIVVQRSTGYAIAGNHRLLAARRLSMQQVPVVVVDVDDDTALRIMLRDNRISDQATYNDHALLELLTELDATEAKLAGTGWADGELDALLNPPPPPEASTSAPDPLCCPQCGHQWVASKH